MHHRLLGQLVGAAVGGLRLVQRGLLALLVEDWVTTARLVELACINTRELLGGVPSASCQVSDGRGR